RAPRFSVERVEPVLHVLRLLTRRGPPMLAGVRLLPAGLAGRNRAADLLRHALVHLVLRLQLLILLFHLEQLQAVVLFLLLRLVIDLLPFLLLLLLPLLLLLTRHFLLVVHIVLLLVVVVFVVLGSRTGSFCVRLVGQPLSQ
ncbi:unnamed protein product, partial [Ectocarpus sp. 8 AP-2014]